jgi:hypothetical protein
VNDLRNTAGHTSSQENSLVKKLLNISICQSWVLVNYDWQNVNWQEQGLMGN